MKQGKCRPLQEIQVKDLNEAKCKKKKLMSKQKLQINITTCNNIVTTKL